MYILIEEYFLSILFNLSSTFMYLIFFSNMRSEYVTERFLVKISWIIIWNQNIQFHRMLRACFSFTVYSDSFFKVSAFSECSQIAGNTVIICPQVSASLMLIKIFLTPTNISQINAVLFNVWTRNYFLVMSLFMLL